MKALWNYVLTTNVNRVWFALACLLLLSLSLLIKANSDIVGRVFDDTVEQVGHPMPHPLQRSS